jgi:AsmA-like C-terminal region/AsmA family
VSRLSFKQRVVTAAVLILLALFLVRPGVSRLKARIANSLSGAVARPVEIGSVHLRFLPPGFDLRNLVIYEDPAFGAEPMLRAPEVTAVVRLTSLVRGRLDIARLELTEPSLNLVRRPDGHWNWAALLERTARTPLAPTAKSRAEARPGFPYIEASSGRINFKLGPEKKPYALLNADFAVWQESENTWGTRLKAEPLRTDMSLSDTGLMRMSGTWQRAGSLRETPLQFILQWESAQLGQLTKLIAGNDSGWRGEVGLEASLSGTPSDMKVSTDVSIRDFHRYDISSSEGLRLATHCDASYSSTEAMLHNILCSSPVGSGTMTLRGDAGLPAVHKIELALNLENVPVSAAAQLARRAKKALPADLVSTGSLQGDFAVSEDGVAALMPEFQGHGQITDLHLQSALTQVEFTARSIPFTLNRHGSGWRSKTRTAPKPAAEVLPTPEELNIEFGPFPVALGRPVPALARGWLARSGYGIVLRGDGEVAHSLRLATLLGLPALKASVEGAAQMELQIAGTWAGSVSGASSGFSLPELTGTVQLHNVRAEVKGVSEPIEILSAQLALAHDGARVDKLIARAAAALWTGSIALPRGCGTPGACLIRFNVNTEEMALGDLYEWLGSQPAQRRWYQILAATKPEAPSFLESLRATGRVSASRLLIHNVAASRVSAAIDLDRGKLKISDLRANVLGGKCRSDWHADFTGGPPVYAGSATLTAISLQQVADAMHDPWISGTASGTFQLTASGGHSTAFWQSAEGELQFDLRDAIFSHLSLTSDEGPLQIVRWQGNARLRAGKIEIETGRMVSPTGSYGIIGNASLNRLLDLKMTRLADVNLGAASQVYGITGTVAEPRVSLTPVSETQARLKP